MCYEAQGYKVQNSQLPLFCSTSNLLLFSAICICWDIYYPVILLCFFDADSIECLDNTQFLLILIYFYLIFLCGIYLFDSSASPLVFKRCK